MIYFFNTKFLCFVFKNVDSIKNLGSWLCRTCSMGQKPECVLCPNKGGAMKSTRSGEKWAHVSCALWIPEVSIGSVDRMEPITKISSIPGSRWALICVLCRERVGACIQCSVKTCKTAYHVTCAFQHGLEMRAIIEDENAEDGVKLRSYCQKHSKKEPKNACNDKSNAGGHDNEEDKTSKKRTRKDMTSEERNQVRLLRTKEIEEQFDKHVSIKDISCHLLDVDQEGINHIYNFWILKRKASGNRPLLTPKSDDVDVQSQNQEQADAEKMKTFVHLRQDLERVRNLCYMVSRRQKLSRSYVKMREQIFHKQISVLNKAKQNKLDDTCINAISEANHGPSIYDVLYSSETYSVKQRPIDKMIDSILGIKANINSKSSLNSSNINNNISQSGAVSSGNVFSLSNTSNTNNNNTTNNNKKSTQDRYTLFNGAAKRGNSNLLEHSSASDTDSTTRTGREQRRNRKDRYRRYMDDNSSLSSVSSRSATTSEDEGKNNRESNSKSNTTSAITSNKKSNRGESSLAVTARRRKSTHNYNSSSKNNYSYESSSEEDVTRPSQQRTLHQMEKELDHTNLSDESDELIDIKNSAGYSIQTGGNKKVVSAEIYSDTDSGSSDKDNKTDHTVSDSQQQPFRTKAAMKEFNIEEFNKQKKLVAPQKSQQQNPVAASIPTKVHEKENAQNKKIADLMVVPQRVAAKKASENLMRTNANVVVAQTSTSAFENIKEKRIKEEQLHVKQTTPTIAVPEKKDADSKDIKRNKSVKENKKPVKQSVDDKQQQKLKEKDLEKEMRKQKEKEQLEQILAYVPQRQAAKKASESIKSGLGKTPEVPIVNQQPLISEEKDKNKTAPASSSQIKRREERKSVTVDLSSSSSDSSSGSSDSGSSSSSESDPEPQSKKTTKSTSAKQPTKQSQQQSQQAGAAGKSKTKDSPFLDKVTKSSVDHSSSSSSDDSSSDSSSSDDDDSASRLSPKTSNRSSGAGARSRHQSTSSPQKKSSASSVTASRKKSPIPSTSSANKKSTTTATGIAATANKKEIDSKLSSPSKSGSAFDSKSGKTPITSPTTPVNTSTSKVSSNKSRTTESSKGDLVKLPDKRKSVDIKEVEFPVPAPPLVSPIQDMPARRGRKPSVSQPPSKSPQESVKPIMSRRSSRSESLLLLKEEKEKEERLAREKKEKEDRDRKLKDERDKKLRLEREEAERKAKLQKEADEKTRQQKLRDEKLRLEREESERKAKLQKEIDEKLRLEREESERKAKLQKEADEKLRLEREAAEKLRLEREAAEKLRLECEAAEKLKLQKEADEKLRQQKLKDEKLRLEREAAEKLRLEREAAEKLRLEREAAEKLRDEKLRLEREESERKIKLQKEADKKLRLEREEAERKAKLQKEADEKLRLEKEKKERLQRERKPSKSYASSDIIEIKDSPPTTQFGKQDKNRKEVCNDDVDNSEVTMDIDETIAQTKTISENRLLDKTFLERHTLEPFVSPLSVFAANENRSLNANVVMESPQESVRNTQDLIEKLRQKRTAGKCGDSNVPAQQDKHWQENELYYDLEMSKSAKQNEISNNSSNAALPPNTNSNNKKMPSSSPQNDVNVTGDRSRWKKDQENIKSPYFVGNQNENSNYSLNRDPNVLSPKNLIDSTNVTKPIMSDCLVEQQQLQMQQKQLASCQKAGENNMFNMPPPQQSQSMQSPNEMMQYNINNRKIMSPQAAALNSLENSQPMNMMNNNNHMNEFPGMHIPGMQSNYNFNNLGENQYPGSAVSLFPPNSNVNVPMPFPSPGQAMFPPNLNNYSTSSTPNDQSIMMMQKQDDNLQMIANQPNYDLNMGQQNTSFPYQRQQSQQQPLSKNMSPLDSRSSCEKTPKSYQDSKKSPSKSVRASPRFSNQNYEEQNSANSTPVQSNKTPQKSPSKSPRQPNDPYVNKSTSKPSSNKSSGNESKSKNKSRNNSAASTPPSNNSSSNNNRGKGRGGRGRGRINTPFMPLAGEFDLSLKFAGTVYAFNDEEINPGVENFQSIRASRKSNDFFGKVGREMDMKSSVMPTLNNHTIPNSLGLNDGSAVPQSTSASTSLAVDPVLPGPVDMRTYSTYDSNEGFNSTDALGAFASNTVDLQLLEINEETEKELQTALKASSSKSDMTLAANENTNTKSSASGSAFEAHIEESVDSDASFPKAPESRHLLKLKIKGPLKPDQYSQISVQQQSNLESISHSLVAPNNMSTGSSGTSKMRMRKKELLRQYCAQDMNTDEQSSMQSVDQPSHHAPTNTQTNRTVFFPRAVDSMSSLPTKEDYKDYDKADYKKRRKMMMSRELKQLDDPLNATPLSHNNSSAEFEIAGTSNNKRRNRGGRVQDSIQEDQQNLNTGNYPPKLKIKIGLSEALETDQFGRPPKKRINANPPTFEDIKRESMDFRKRVFEEFQKEKDVKRSRKEEKKKKKKDKKDKEKHSLEIVTPNESDNSASALPKLIIRYSKPSTSATTSSAPASKNTSISEDNTSTANQSVPSESTDPPPAVGMKMNPLKLTIVKKGDQYATSEKKKKKKKGKDAAGLKEKKEDGDDEKDPLSVADETAPKENPSEEKKATEKDKEIPSKSSTAPTMVTSTPNKPSTQTPIQPPIIDADISNVKTKIVAVSLERLNIPFPNLSPVVSTNNNNNTNTNNNNNTSKKPTVSAKDSEVR